MYDDGRKRRHTIIKTVRRSANDDGNDLNCPTGKVRYDSRRKARKGIKVGRGVGGRAFREYPCLACTGWHLSSKDKH